MTSAIVRTEQEALVQSGREACEQNNAAAAGQGITPDAVDTGTTPHGGNLGRGEEGSHDQVPASVSSKAV